MVQVVYTVRMVRGGLSTRLLSIDRPTTDYLDQGDGTVLHAPTRLVWQRCAIGQTWSGSACDGTPIAYNWQDAKLLTSTLAGHTDWRLPNEEELLSLVDYSRHSPAMNYVMFPDTGTLFWSSTPVARLSNYAWYVNFYDGTADVGLPSDSSVFARLVRTTTTLKPANLTPILMLLLD